MSQVIGWSLISRRGRRWCIVHCMTPRCHALPVALAAPSDHLTPMPVPSIEHQRFEQRRLAERIIAEVVRLRQAIDRHPRCGVELDRVATVLHELSSVSALLETATNPRIRTA